MLLEGLRLYGRDWKRIQQHVGTRNAAQLRSHAQKYFVKVLREGTDEFIPPPQSRRTAISLALPLPLARGPAAAESRPATTTAASLVRQVEGNRHGEGACGEPGSPLSDKGGRVASRPRTPLGLLGSEEVQERAESPRAVHRPAAPSPLRPRELGAMPARSFSFAPPSVPPAARLQPPALLPTASVAGLAVPLAQRGAGVTPSASSLLAFASSDAEGATRPAADVPLRAGPAQSVEIGSGASAAEQHASVGAASQSYESVAQARAAIMRLAGSQGGNLHMLSLVADTIRVHC